MENKTKRYIRSPEEKEMIVKEYMAGEKVSAVSKKHGISTTTLRDWTKKYIADNGLEPMRKQRKVAKLSLKSLETEIESLKRVISETDKSHKAEIADKNRDLTNLKKLIGHGFERIESLEEFEVAALELAGDESESKVKYLQHQMNFELQKTSWLKKRIANKKQAIEDRKGLNQTKKLS